jgi:hypothetical protein
VAKLSTDKLFQDKKKLPQEGLELENNSTNDLGNHAIAMIHGGQDSERM